MSKRKGREEPPHPLWTVLQAAAREVEAMMASRGHPCEVFPAAALSLGPQLSSLWIAVKHDRTRDALKRDAELPDQIREKVREAGYPPDYVASVGIVFQSQETVDRDYEGSWFYAMR